jgi:mRNA interferase MazF
LKPNKKSGIKKKSVVDCFQIRAVSHNRFAEKIGELVKDEIDQIKRAIALILDIESEHCEE